MLSKVFQLRKGSVISFIGAGGKTSLISCLVKEIVRAKLNILVTTTTAMFYSDFRELDFNGVFFGDLVDFMSLFTSINGIFLAARRYNFKNKKIVGYDAKEIDLIARMKVFDYIFVEADGAKMNSIKIHNDFEPVLPFKTNIVVGLMGINSFDKFLKKNVHRSELFSTFIVDKEVKIIDKNFLSSIIFSNIGFFKNIGNFMQKIIVLNGADNLFLIRKSIKLVQIIDNSHFSVDYLLFLSLCNKESSIRLII